MLAAVNLAIVTVCLAYVSASLLDDIGLVVPPLEMPIAQLSLLVLFTAGPLKGRLVLHFVLGKLGGRLLPWPVPDYPEPRQRMSRFLVHPLNVALTSKL